MPKNRPNVVFIVLDTHRADRLGCFGYGRGTSPNIDAFASRATVFEEAVSPGQWTIPAHASMFTGEFPTTHTLVQSSSALDARFRTLAERLREDGYRTVGFCNNPLVGVLNNGLKRGFETFYNYGGAIPTRPEKPVRGVRRVWHKIWAKYTLLLRKISYPVQNMIAQSDKFFQLILNPFIVPLWAKYAHFKGDTAASLADAVEFIDAHFNQGKQPHFMFINLMGTHLPYGPPENFVSEFAPILKENKKARDFLHAYNNQAVRWFIPMAEPFTDLEYQALSQMYDAEVAYQDSLLADLLRRLDSPGLRENTLVVIVSDHGEMLGEHQVMGHGLGVYEELIHVPLIVRAPGQQRGSRVAEPVSTTFLFHTVLDAVGREVYATVYAPEIDIQSLSLLPLARGARKAPRQVYSEAYPPDHVIKTIRNFDASLIDRFHSDRAHWAAYEEQFKLIHIQEVRDLLLDLGLDPTEFTLADDQVRSQNMRRDLEEFIARMEARRPNNLSGGGVTLDDEKLAQRLRGLGYLE